MEELPVELKTKIFEFLDTKSLKYAALVSKNWRQIADDSVQWKKTTISIRDETDADKIFMARSRRIENVNVKECEEESLNLILASVAGLPNLKQILGLADKYLMDVDENVLSEIVQKVEKGDFFNNTIITPDQADVIIEKLKEKFMIDLVVKNQDLTSVDASSLCKALNNVTALWLSDYPRVNTLTNMQLQSFFSTMANSTSVKELLLHDIDISQIAPHTLAYALSNVEEFVIWGTNKSSEKYDLSRSQIRALLLVLSKNESRLTRMLLPNTEMIHVELIILAEGLASLSEVNLYQDMISGIQASALFHVLSSKTTLKALRIFNIDLSNVDPSNMAKSLRYVQELKLVNCHLTRDQVTEIFRVLCEGNTVKVLYIGGSDLSILDPELLANLATKLESITFRDNELTTDHLIFIMRNCAEAESKLGKLRIVDTRLDDVQGELLARGIANIQEVELESCSLRVVQVEKILAYLSHEEAKTIELLIVNDDLDITQNILEDAMELFHVNLNI